MNLVEAQNLAVNLMQQHGLHTWRFEFDRAKRRFGCCNYTLKLITLSSELVRINEVEQVRDTILHEIAHALVGHKHGHNAVWQRKAIEIGCNGERCFSGEDTNLVTGKYIATCPKCNHVHTKHRRPKKVASCGKCARVFDRERILVYQER